MPWINKHNNKFNQPWSELQGWFFVAETRRLDKIRNRTIIGKRT